MGLIYNIFIIYMKKSKIKTKKKNNNKKIIHQIFFNIGKGELKDIKPFYKCYKHNKEYCKKNNIKYLSIGRG